MDFCGKFRRPVRKSKLITDNLYGSSYVYLKFVIIWALVLAADFVLEFRFEYLWPFWLLLRSVYDSFKYQGLAFSVFFIFIALTSDMICFLFIPVHWLFFAASTYVWVQYVWHTEKGICLPTISLWLIFVYIEASIRLKELKNSPFHLDLCRPFAAHCIGYPVVTLGFGFKSHISYKMGLRKQKEVAKENEFYFELLQQALPQESSPQIQANGSELAPVTATAVLTNGVSHTALNQNSHPHNSSNKKPISNSRDRVVGSTNHTSNTKLNSEYDVKKCTHNGIDKQELQYMEHLASKRSSNSTESEAANDDSSAKDSSKNSTPLSSSKSPSSNTQASLSISTSNKWNHSSNSTVSSYPTNTNPLPSGNGHVGNASGKKTKNLLANNVSTHKDDHVLRLEADLKKLKIELQSSRQLESELRSQISSLLSDEKNLKAKVLQLQQDKEDFEVKLQNLLTARQQDKHQVSQLKERLQEEKKSRVSYESQLASERKAKKDEARTAAVNVRIECTESCKNKCKQLENEVKQLRKDLRTREDQVKAIDNEAQTLRHYKNSQEDTEILMSALSAMQDKTQHLESSLSAETRLKLDLFSALGDAKRHLEISQAHINQKDRQIEELTAAVNQLKTRLADVMAILPSTTFPSLDNNHVSSLMFNSKFIPNPNDSRGSPVNSPLDPNAAIYTPKSSDL